MKQSKYEAKKAMLKRIKSEWGARLRNARGQGGCDYSRLSYGDLIHYYTEAQQTLINFIHTSILYNHGVMR